MHESIAATVQLGFTPPVREELRDRPFTHDNRTFRWSTNVYVFCVYCIDVYNIIYSCFVRRFIKKAIQI